MKRILIISSFLAVFAIQPALATDFQVKVTPKKLESRGSAECIPSSAFYLRSQFKKLPARIQGNKKLVRVEFDGSNKQVKAKGVLNLRGKRAIITSRLKVEDRKFATKHIVKISKKKGEGLILKKANVRELAKAFDEEGNKHACLFAYN